MKVFAVTYDTNCDHTGCKEKAVGLFGDLTLCRVHIDEYQKKPMSKEDREMWTRINNERQGIYPGDFD